MSRSLICLSLAALGCSAGSSSREPSCPREGVVPPELRDVERDAEGVSYSVFGPYPDRAPDFARAAGVFSLLRQVWDEGQATCPELPTEVVAGIDDAIGSLTISIDAEDQLASAYAANDIHLQMAPLFAYFNPNTPIEVVDMDALFLRIGLDAWFERPADYDADLSALQADWARLEAAAAAKVPTCHRVAGTGSVVGDVGDTLANLAAAPGGSDKDVAQVESDAGLLEVDILELLYDCVPDGEHPSVGLGAACQGDRDCDAGQVCDPANAGGTCAPTTGSTNIGQPCTTTVDCGTYPRDACNNEVGDGFPGGYCTLEPCDDVQVCPPGGTCVALPFETPSCMQSCGSDTDCRVADGYVCQLFPTTPPAGFGPSDHACAFACPDDAGCTPPLTCDVGSGRCVP
jgi:hypothetical protein